MLKIFIQIKVYTDNNMQYKLFCQYQYNSCYVTYICIYKIKYILDRTNVALICIKYLISLTTFMHFSCLFYLQSPDTIYCDIRIFILDTFNLFVDGKINRIFLSISSRNYILILIYLSNAQWVQDIYHCPDFELFKIYHSL